MYKQPESQKRSRSGMIAFYTLLCFSLAGLVMGFSIGGLAGHLSSNMTGGAGSPTTSEPVLTGHRPDPALSATPENISLSVQAIGPGDYTSPQVANGTTSYRLTTQIVNMVDKMPIRSSHVVCRLWLARDLQATTAGLSADNFAIPRNPSTFNQPFPAEVVGALNFTAPTTQTQPCAANGKTQWNYTLSPSVPRGTYYLAVLADWKGVHYNWYMVAIEVRESNQDDATLSSGF